MKTSVVMNLKHNSLDELGGYGKSANPYNYGPIVRFSDDQQSKGTLLSEWSDHLQRRGYENFDELKMKHFGRPGDYWGNEEPAKIQAFLSDLLDLPKLHLVMVTEECHQQTGYPVWHFNFEDLAGE